MGCESIDDAETTPLVMEGGLSHATGQHCGAADQLGSASASSTASVADPGCEGSGKLKTAIVGLSSTLTYIALSASMILFNKFLMRPDVFPFPVTLTSLHMVSSLLLGLILQHIFPSLFPAYSRVFPKRCGELDNAADSPVIHLQGVLRSLMPFIPIGVCAAICLVSGNTAYQYASVSFLQMVKESHVMIVYILMLIVGLDTFKFRMAAVLVFVVCSAVVAVYGDVYFSWQGLLLQLLSGLSGSGQLVLNNLLMSRSSMGKIDPLTLVLCTAPVILIALIPVNFFFWDARIPGLLQQWAPYIFCNAILAVGLQISAATLIWVTSATGYAVACVAKDVAIVGAAQMLLHESVTTMQVSGFAGSIVGVGIYSAMKLFPELAGGPPKS